MPFFSTGIYSYTYIQHRYLTYLGGSLVHFRVLTVFFLQFFFALLKTYSSATMAFWAQDDDQKSKIRLVK